MMAVMMCSEYQHHLQKPAVHALQVGRLVPVLQQHVQPPVLFWP